MGNKSQQPQQGNPVAPCWDSLRRKIIVIGSGLSTTKSAERMYHGNPDVTSIQSSEFSAKFWPSSYSASHSPGKFNRVQIPLRRKCYAELDGIYNECSKVNWDGYGARAVRQSLRSVVALFLNKLSGDIPDPEISPDPDGEISLDWFCTPSRTFSISIGSKGRLTYASIHGESKTSGVDVFKKKIPQAILNRLQEFFHDKA